MKFNSRIKIRSSCAVVVEHVDAADDEGTHLAATGRFFVACPEHGAMGSDDDHEHAALIAYQHNADLHAGAEVVTVTVADMRARSVASIERLVRSRRNDWLRIFAVVAFQTALLAIFLSWATFAWVPTSLALVNLGRIHARFTQNLEEERENLANFDEMFGGSDVDDA